MRVWLLIGTAVVIVVAVLTVACYGLSGFTFEKRGMWLQRQVHMSDAIVVCLLGDVHKIHDVGPDGYETWEGECRVDRALKGRFETPKVIFAFQYSPLKATDKEHGRRLRKQQTYILFLKDVGSDSLHNYTLLQPHDPHPNSVFEYGSYFDPLSNEETPWAYWVTIEVNTQERFRTEFMTSDELVHGIAQIVSQDHHH